MRNDNQHFLFQFAPKISHEILVVFLTIQIITFWANTTLAFIRLLGTALNRKEVQ